MKQPRPWKVSASLALLVLCAASLGVYLWLLSSHMEERLTSDGNDAVTDKQDDFSGLKIWSSDFHISPIQDIKHILRTEFGVQVIDKSMSGHCHLTHTCATDLRVIHRDNGITLGDCPNRLRRRFYQEYIDDPEFQSADAIVCLHAASLCEIFMPFNKPLIVIASTRYDIGRYRRSDTAPLKRWNENLKRIAAKSSINTVAANNIYDAQYIRFFTGINNIQFIPSSASYLEAEAVGAAEEHRQHNRNPIAAQLRAEARRPEVTSIPSQPAAFAPTRLEFIVGPSRDVHDTIYNRLQESIGKHNRRIGKNYSAGADFTGVGDSFLAEYSSAEGRIGRRSGGNMLDEEVAVHTIRELYPRYEFSDLKAHVGLVLIPYQVSLMSFFEYYRLGIPLFVPSAELLTHWHVKHGVLNERTWDLVENMPMKFDSSPLPRFNGSTSSADQCDFLPWSASMNRSTSKGISMSKSWCLTSDPNDEVSEEALLDWVRLSDYYQYPYIVQFDSIPELVLLLAHFKAQHVRHHSGSDSSTSPSSTEAEYYAPIRAKLSTLPSSLGDISKGMRLFITSTLDRHVKDSWTNILRKVVNHCKRSSSTRTIPFGRSDSSSSFQPGQGQVAAPHSQGETKKHTVPLNVALRESYGVELVKGVCNGMITYD